MICPHCGRTIHTGSCPEPNEVISVDEYKLTIHLPGGQSIELILPDKESAEGFASQIKSGTGVAIFAKARTPMVVRRSVFVPPGMVCVCVVEESPASEYALELGRKMGL
jgi:hypothetical protein